VSLVSVQGENWTQMAENIETIEIAEIVAIASIHAGYTHVAENMLG
jgi:hypothetical protein